MYVIVLFGPIMSISPKIANFRCFFAILNARPHVQVNLNSSLKLSRNFRTAVSCYKIPSDKRGRLIKTKQDRCLIEHGIHGIFCRVLNLAWMKLRSLKKLQKLTCRNLPSSVKLLTSQSRRTYCMKMIWCELVMILIRLEANVLILFFALKSTVFIVCLVFSFQRC